MYYVDINKDSKKDLIVSPNIANNSENFESIKLFTNTGVNNAPLFEFTQNNFLQDKTIDFGSGAYPCVMDYNNDGLKDLLVGNFGYFDSGDQLSQLALFKNIGTNEQPAFELIDRDFGGLSNIALNTTLNITVSGLTPTIGDLDNDGDDDGGEGLQCDSSDCPENHIATKKTDADGKESCECVDAQAVGDGIKAIGTGLALLAVGGVVTTGLIGYAIYRIIRG